MVFRGSIAPLEVQVTCAVNFWTDERISSFILLDSSGGTVWQRVARSVRRTS